MFTIVNSSEIATFGTWSAGFYNNEGYRSLKKYPPHRIMEMGDEYLQNASDYEIKEMIRFTARGFAGPLYVVKAPLERVQTMRLIDLVSSTVQKRLGDSLEARSITKVAKTREEHLQVAVMLMWIASIMNSDDKRKSALETRQRLIDELREVEKYLGVSNDGKRIG